MSVTQHWSRRTSIGAGAVLALIVTGLAVAATPSHAQPDRPSDPAGRLVADADGTITVRAGFLGTDAGTAVDNPAVTAGTGVVAAARAHVARYGGAVDADAGRLDVLAVQRTVAGRSLVRFGQEIDGLPVIGGEVVVTLDADRELGSMLATTSTAAAEIPTARVPERVAARAARTLVARMTGTGRTLSTTSAGRWVFDPAVLGASGAPQSVWRIEVGDGAGVRRLVLIDDQTGSVALQVDELKTISRVVCDNHNKRRGALPTCTSGFARTETSGAARVRDVNEAFEFSGDVAEFYAEIGGLDLTEMLGIRVGGTKRLASSVRWCTTSDSCPYFNAFWDGRQMFYGRGFTAAEDVVGHEMTHGVIDQYAKLFYWGQSGAINESMADVMGEIVDHRVPAGTDAAGDWTMGEDLQKRIDPTGKIDLRRNLRNPGRHGQPARMTSRLYTADLRGQYPDNGGVHTNSGVGNKTAYLISQGGTFNGQTITGIDGDDAGLTKTATLYLNAIQTLSAGSDYADLADVLEQGCQDLVGTAGFTQDDCDNVAKAVAATELRTTPPAAPQPADAPTTCPGGDEPVVLLDSESGDPAATFSAGKGWTRRAPKPWGATATSGTESWSNTTNWTSAGMRPKAQSLTSSAGIALPAGRRAYLRFQGWYLLDHGSLRTKPAKTRWFDGGTVEVRADGRWVDAAKLPWVNGPRRTLFRHFDNPAAGRKAFAGDSSGWVASRVDLSRYAGSTVKPRFTMNFDDGGTFLGWYLDDVTVYTCDA